jgi:crotonobetainyl-CoA:carnitine CoA-transferase CaiB-like acyl-CoA transferase
LGISLYFASCFALLSLLFSLSHYDHPQAGRLRQARAPSRFSAAPEQHWQGAPRLGEQTGELLAECGYSAEEIQSMCDSGIAAVPAK